MLTKQRHEEMVNIIRERGSVTTNEMAKILGISESTARRDINFLADTGKVIKVYGGAMFDPQDVDTKEDSFEQRMDINATEKGKAAEKALELITPDDFIYIDAGTTTEFLIDYIDISVSAVFVTNGIVHAKKLISKGFKTYMAGGLIRAKTEAVVGSEAVESIKKFNFTKSFIGANGIHLFHGFTTVDTDEAMLKKEAVNHSYVSYVLADHTKFGKVTAVTFAPLEKACIVTDGIVKDKYKELTLIKEVHVE